MPAECCVASAVRGWGIVVLCPAELGWLREALAFDADTTATDDLERSADRRRAEQAWSVGLGWRPVAETRWCGRPVHVRVLAVPQPVLRTDRLLLVPLADRHLDLEAELDSDPEVLAFLYGRARSRAEVIESHAERMALARTVDGLGYWIAFGTDGGRRGSTAPAREEDGDFIGLMMLPPAHGPDQSDDPAVCDLGRPPLAARRELGGAPTCDQLGLNPRSASPTRSEAPSIPEFTIHCRGRPT